MNDEREDRGDIAVAERLTKHFTSGAATVKAVDEVNFRLPRYAIVALQGPTRCGNGTLLHLIGALDGPASGAAGVAGVSVGRPPRTRSVRDLVSPPPRRGLAPRRPGTEAPR